MATADEALYHYDVGIRDRQGRADASQLLAGTVSVFPLGNHPEDRTRTSSYRRRLLYGYPTRAYTNFRLLPGIRAAYRE